MSSYRDAQPPGFEVTTELRTWDSKNKCPRCDIEMFAGEKDASGAHQPIRVEACGRCGGIWFADEQAKRALALGSRAAEELARKVEGATRPRLKDDTKLLRCPECQDRMKPMTVGGQTGLQGPMVDTCIRHGTWFDRDELRPAMRLMRGENPEEPKGLEARYLESLRSPWSGELADVQRTLSAVLQSILRR